MKKVIRLTETDLTRIIKRIINETDSMDDLIHRTFHDGFRSDRSSEYDDPIFNDLKEYLDAGCITYKKVAGFLIFDVGAPYDFVDCGFSRNDAAKVKSKLRNKGFNSFGVGEYGKRIG